MYVHTGETSNVNYEAYMLVPARAVIKKNSGTRDSAWLQAVLSLKKNDKALFLTKVICQNYGNFLKDLSFIYTIKNNYNWCRFYMMHRVDVLETIYSTSSFFFFRGINV